MRYSASRAASAMRAVDLDGDVLDRADEARRLAGAVGDRRHVDARPAVDAGHDAHVERGALAQRPRAAELADEALAVVGRHALEPRRAVEDLAGHVEDLAQALVGVGQPAVVGDGEDADGRRRRPASGSAPRSRPARARRRGARRCRPSARGSTAGAPSALRTTVTSQRDPRLAAVGAQVALLGAVGVPLAGRERAHRLAVVVVVGGVGDVAHRHPGELLAARGPSIAASEWLTRTKRPSVPVIAMPMPASSKARWKRSSASRSAVVSW